MSISANVKFKHDYKHVSIYDKISGEYCLDTDGKYISNYDADTSKHLTFIANTKNEDGKDFGDITITGRHGDTEYTKNYMITYADRDITFHT